MAQMGTEDFASKHDFAAFQLAMRKDFEALQLAITKDFEAFQLANQKDHEILEYKLRAEIHRSGRNLVLSFTAVMAVLNGILFAALKLG